MRVGLPMVFQSQRCDGARPTIYINNKHYLLNCFNRNAAMGLAQSIITSTSCKKQPTELREWKLPKSRKPSRLGVRSSVHSEFRNPRLRRKFKPGFRSVGRQANR